MHRAVDHWKAQGLDLSAILYRPRCRTRSGAALCDQPGPRLERALDQELLKLAAPALEAGEPVTIEMPIRNVNRTVGTILGSELSRRYGFNGLPNDTITINFAGSAGQSFGASSRQA